jgi:hypothetical protein
MSEGGVRVLRRHRPVRAQERELPCRQARRPPRRRRCGNGARRGRRLGRGGRARRRDRRSRGRRRSARRPRARRRHLRQARPRLLSRPGVRRRRLLRRRPLRGVRRLLRAGGPVPGRDLRALRIAGGRPVLRRHLPRRGARVRDRVVHPVRAARHALLRGRQLRERRLLPAEHLPVRRRCLRAEHEPRHVRGGQVLDLRRSRRALLWLDLPPHAGVLPQPANPSAEGTGEVRGLRRPRPALLRDPESAGHLRPGDVVQARHGRRVLSAVRRARAALLPRADLRRDRLLLGWLLHRRGLLVRARHGIMQGGTL